LSDLPQPTLSGISKKIEQPVFDASELAAKPPQAPETPKKDFSSRPLAKARKPSMTDPEDDPWNSPEVHRGHNHADVPHANGDGPLNGQSYDGLGAPDLHQRTTSNFTTPAPDSAVPSGRQSAASGSVSENTAGAWNYFDNPAPNPESGFEANPGASPFGGEVPAASHQPSANPAATHTRTISGGRVGSSVEENVLVTLMPEKEGMFMFQHHNYEVTSTRRGSRVIRRYSDFVWLLDCLHKRYPFRVLPLLPPKRVAVNGNHLSNDGGFIEKRRRGLGRFLNAVVRHPILGQEQLVVMFLTVPTVSCLA
jgi:sorting nexin-8